jgi:hypothetical protein
MVFSSPIEAFRMKHLFKTLNYLLDRLVAILLHAYQQKIGKPLIIGAEQYGRIGNRLYLGAHLVAWAQKKNALLLHPGFHDYEDLFAATCCDALVRFPERKEPLRLPLAPKKMLRLSLDRLSIRFLNQEHKIFQTLDLQPGGLNIAANGFLDQVTARPINFIRGFIYNNTCTHIVDALPEIKNHYRPKRCYIPLIESPINNLRETCDLVLGIVIRHGDFKSWRGGEYFFPTEEYIQFMDQCVALLKDIRIGFFIASDEEQDATLFEHHTFYFRAGHPLENLHSLAACDGMIAAASSFTGWSQYYGGVPVWHIRKDGDRNSLQQMLDHAIEKAHDRQKVRAT